MEHTFKELKKKRVAELREIASGIDNDAVSGYMQLNKDNLLEAICKALNIETHEHHKVVGLDKPSIKKKIRKLKKDREKAIEDHNKTLLKEIRLKIKNHKKQLRRATV